jgi:hypothetical protein
MQTFNNYWPRLCWTFYTGELVLFGIQVNLFVVYFVTLPISRTVGPYR